MKNILLSLSTIDQHLELQSVYSPEGTILSIGSCDLNWCLFLCNSNGKVISICLLSPNLWDLSQVWLQDQILEESSATEYS